MRLRPAQHRGSVDPRALGAVAAVAAFEDGAHDRPHAPRRRRLAGVGDAAKLAIRLLLPQGHLRDGGEREQQAELELEIQDLVNDLIAGDEIVAQR